MSDDEKENGWPRRLRQRIAELPKLIGEGWRADMVAFRNWWRRRRRAEIDYVVLSISGSLPERSGPRRNFFQRQLPLPPQPLSLQELNNRVQAIMDADNVQGAVILLGQLTVPGLSTLQNLRRSLQRLGEAGKRTVVFTPHLDLAHYYVACAAERVVVPPAAQFEVLGLHAEAVFLKEALDNVGLEAEVLQISPYKTAGNIVDKADITPEQREQMEWLLDDNYDVITAGIAQGRGKTQEEIQALIDRAPMFAEEILAEGLADDVAYEDELAGLLCVPEEEGAAVSETTEDESKQDTANDEPWQTNQTRAELRTWSEARSLLLEKARTRSRKSIGVVSLEGTIIMGSSRQPPVDIPIPFVGGAMAGEETINAILRQAERNDRLAALILHVDSGGGSALASDLIDRQIKRIARKKPVLAYMGNVAASGGYYVCASATKIMAQPGTTTGSIGVITGRINAGRLYEKLGIGRASVKRGEHAGLFREPRPLTDEERELLWDGVTHTYEQFKQVVAEGRELALDDVEPIAGGRVWTGRQAHSHQLVDMHGDFVDAVYAAAEMAGLPADGEHEVRVVNLHAPDHERLLPEPYEKEKELLRLVLGERIIALGGKPLALLPYEIRFH